jgi:hypothetical protein
VAILCRAEFACGAAREAVLMHQDRSGEQQSQRIRLGDGADGSAVLLAQEWALACENPALRVRNRFRAEEVARCAFSWSFRGASGLNIKMSVVSREVELAPGQQCALTSDYDLRDFPIARVRT